MSYILTATPAYHGDVTIQFHRSFIAMLRLAITRNIELREGFTSDSFVSHSRNTAAAFALQDPNCTHLLTIDADMGWEPNLLFDMIDADKDVIAAVYPRRTGNHQFLFQPDSPDRNPQYQSRFAPAKAVGCGFMLIKRSALLTMRYQYPDRAYKDSTIPSLQIYDLFPSGADLNRHVCITDDVGFCQLARASGVKVYADLAARCTHTGPATVQIGSYLDNCA